MAIKVLLADDHAMLREGVQLILEKENDIRVVASTGNGREAVRLARQLRPDVAILDLAMPVMNGVEAARQVLDANPDIRVIMLSMHSTAEHIHRALAAGASGYILKECIGSEVVEAIRTVTAGRRYLSAEVTDTVFHDYANLKRDAQKASPVESLSFREREVLQLVVEGKSSKEIAALIHLSPKTVESYRSRMMDKLGTKDIPSLVKFAIAHGLTTSS